MNDKLGGVVAMLVAGVMLATVGPVSATKGPDHKVDICHHAQGNGKVILISVDRASVPKHIANHGDYLAPAGARTDEDCKLPSGPTGACCAAQCQVVTEAGCDALGGLYLGDGSSCSPDPCAL